MGDDAIRIAGAGRPPNVVVCLTDMLGAQALGCYGDPCVHTPHIDRLAAEGMRFDVAVTNNPLCTPARSCLMSGQYSRTCTGRTNNTDALWPPAGRPVFPVPTLAERLREAGYETALIGKWHIDADPARSGFDRTLLPNIIHRHYGQEYREDGGPAFTVPEFAPEFEMRRVSDFLRQRRDRPFFLFHNISQPHMPLGPGNCPESYLRMYDRNAVPLRPNVFRDGRMAYDREWFVIYTNPDYWYRKWCLREPPRATDRVPDDYDLRDLTAQYYSLVTCADDQVGALMKSLDAAGLSDDTIVVFLSDHGDNLGSHGCFNKQLLIEESIRIPFIVRWPGRIRPGVDRAHVAQLIDVMPTVLDMCGLPPASGVQGRSLAGLLEGRAGAGRPERAFIETPAGLLGVRTPTHLYGMHVDWATRRITTSRHQFFDLRSDPYELRNLAGTSEQTDVAEELRVALTAWHASTRWMSGADGTARAS